MPCRNFLGDQRDFRRAFEREKTTKEERGEESTKKKSRGKWKAEDKRETNLSGKRGGERKNPLGYEKLQELTVHNI